MKDEATKKCNTIWDKITTDIKPINNEPAYMKKKLKTEKKSHVDEVTDLLPLTSACVKSHKTKWMYFLMTDDAIKKCNTIWDKITADIETINNEPAYMKKKNENRKKI